MQTSKNIKNIVLIGNFQSLIPSFDKYFFIKNNIVAENEILPNSIFDTIGGVQLISNKFYIIITGNQIAVTATKPENNDDKINSVLSAIIKAANIINIEALGINFHIFIVDNSVTMEELSKKYFFNEKIDVFSKYFNTPDTRYGAYASINFKDARLKLDIKPSVILSNADQKKQEGINFAFNFHFDIKSKIDNSEVIKYLGDYNLYEDETGKVISLYK